MHFSHSHSINFSKAQESVFVNRSNAGEEYERIKQMQMKNIKTYSASNFVAARKLARRHFGQELR